jgi:hypothetical protein
MKSYWKKLDSLAKKIKNWKDKYKLNKKILKDLNRNL